MSYLITTLSFFLFFIQIIKAKTGGFYGLIRTLFLIILLCLRLQKPKRQVIRTLFLVLLLCFWLQHQNVKFLCLNKTFVPCSFAWFMAIKLETGIFWDLIKTVSCSFTSFMASKTKTRSFYDLIRPFFLVLVYCFNFQQGKVL